jgi:hypothetical protein
MEGMEEEGEDLLEEFTRHEGKTVRARWLSDGREKSRTLMRVCRSGREMQERRGREKSRRKRRERLRRSRGC